MLRSRGAPPRAGAARARQNIEYRLIEPPQPVETGERIEVIDFFWYGCPYCNELQPFARGAGSRRKPADVALRRVPAILKDTWAPHARIYYTLELLNEVERLHPAVFHSYHVEELHMSKPDVMEQWAVKNGIDKQQLGGRLQFSPRSTRRSRAPQRATQALHRRGHAVARRGRALPHFGQHGAIIKDGRRARRS